MCGCFAILIGAFAPRVALVLLWIFTNWVNVAFNSFIVAVLGLILLPYTTLVYVLVYDPLVGVTGFGWLLVAVGFLCDIGSYTSGIFGRRNRQPSAA